MLLHHHAVEREAVWPALLRAVPADRTDEVRAAVDEWTASCARIDHMLRDVATAARQWAGRRAPPRRATPSRRRAGPLADAVDAQTADEERTLLPLLGAHLRAGGLGGDRRLGRTAGSRRASSCSCSGWRSRTPAPPTAPGCWTACPRSARMAWRLNGGRYYRAAVVRLRGAPPAPDADRAAQ